MSYSTDKSDALRLLRGLEDGAASVAELRDLAQDLDPVLVYVIVRYLREAYPASDPAATAVLERVVALTSAWPGLVAKSKDGEQDSVSAWLAGAYALREFRGRSAELVELVVDKLES